MRYLLLALAATSLWAQDVKFYRLDFTVKELDDARVVSAKKYTTFAGADEKWRSTQIRTGTKVPIQYSTGNGPNQMQYIDVGVNIDVPLLRESNGQLVLDVSAEITSVPVGDGPATSAPIVRQNKWRAMATAEVGKPITLFSSDDLNSKRKMQVELTATLVK